MGGRIGPSVRYVDGIVEDADPQRLKRSVSSISYFVSKEVSSSVRFLNQVEHINKQSVSSNSLLGACRVFGLHLPSYPYEPLPQTVKDVGT